MQQSLSDLASALLSLLTAVVLAITPIIVKWINTHTEANKATIKSADAATKATETQSLTDKIAQLADWAVHEYEAGSSDNQVLTNAVKKSKAVDYVQKGLAKLGLNASDEMISGAIEKAVDLMHRAYEEHEKAMGTTTTTTVVEPKLHEGTGVKLDPDKVTFTNSKEGTATGIKSAKVQPSTTMTTTSTSKPVEQTTTTTTTRHELQYRPDEKLGSAYDG